MKNSEKTTLKTALSELVNPFLQDGQWYKAALHMHTTASDGDVDVPARIKQYIKRGYDLVAITDHWVVNKAGGLFDEKILVVRGMEAHPTFQKFPADNELIPHPKNNHFVCLNLPESFEIKKDLKPQQVIDIVNEAGGGVIYAHPYWMGHTINEMLSVDGYMAIEVYNGVADIRGNGHASVHWDQLLDKGVILPAVAADDVHYSEEIDMGWTMIKAKKLNAKEIINSLKKGCNYASCGPTIEKYWVENRIVKIKCSPVSEISFTGHGVFSSGWVFKGENGKLLTCVEWTPYEGCEFVRAEVTDANGKHAWTNPIALE